MGVWGGSRMGQSSSWQNEYNCTFISYQVNTSDYDNWYIVNHMINLSSTIKLTKHNVILISHRKSV